MIKVERIGDMVMFSDQDQDLGFSCNLLRPEFDEACKQVSLSPDKIEKLYHRMLEFGVVYTEEGKLFKSAYIRKVDPLGIKYDNVKKQSTVDNLVDSITEMADAASQSVRDSLVSSEI